MREILIRGGDDGSGFFDADKRLEALSAKGDPLEAIDRFVPWESFHPALRAPTAFIPPMSFSTSSPASATSAQPA
jgi:hypothetical protein